MVGNPTGTTTCVKHLIHNRNALERQLGTLNVEKRQYTYTLIITLIAIDSMFLLLY